ncbi:hypothetical protein AB0D49_41465 [Streptomyces sp. NPDC048290]|uniref:hypothetical protein n=1 Tax=Streptomyces sp. NPDC048290 TaxID=3155811 RepID=UPI0034232A02
MAELVRQYRLEADVSFRAFGLQESDEPTCPRPSRTSSSTACSSTPFPGAGHTHTALVDVEVWDGQPPERDPSGWDERSVADSVSSSGEVAVWPMSTGRTGDAFALGEPGRWRVRAGCTGRAQAPALSEDEGTGQGVQRHLVEFWHLSGHTGTDK